MAEYKREIGAAVAVAVVLAIVVGATAIFYFPSPSGLTRSTSTGGLVSTQTATVASRTTPLAQTYTNVTMAADTSLTVNRIQGLLQTSSNATTIAQSLALQLNEQPIRLVSQRLPTCSDNSILCTQATYLYKTADDSNITIAFVKGKFYELDYIAQDYWRLTYGNATTNLSFNTTKADVAVEQLMANTFGVSLGNMALVNQFSPVLSSTNYQIQWAQGYQGVPIANSGVIFFQFYPPTSKLVRIIIDENDGWYQIPPNFPFKVQPSAALSSVEGYAASNLHMSSIEYTSVSLQVVGNQMYYAITVSNFIKSYLLFVNPRTGEIGFPQS
ncbi:MAG: hypothetical protein LYZ70_00130 [Nitrososphaerales archaeon]|nr:hypothetical protein [Nitrososphaerales archaeon]